MWIPGNAETSAIGARPLGAQPQEVPMKYRIILLCTAALVSGAALAGEDKSIRSADDTFKELDEDSDGKISQAEAEANSTLSTSFTMIDGNSDGYITKREYRRNTMPKPKNPDRY
jgi:Ca2+-binding EF-hand superfamily protein